MNVIKHKYIFLGISALLLVASVYGLVAYGLQQGIDYTGGTLWEIKFEQQAASSTVALPSREGVREVLVTESKHEDATVTERSDGGFLIKIKEITETEHQAFSSALT